MDKVFLTPSGLESLKKELQELKEKKRPLLIKRVTRARDMGDLSENSEYFNAREELSLIDSRIEELEKVLSQAKIIQNNKVGNKKKKTVTIGSKVTVLIDNKTIFFTVVGEWEADPSSNKISHSSPLGKALLGKKVGDKVEVEVPAGKVVYKVLKIE